MAGLRSNGLEMPSAFPSAAHDGVTECVGTHNQTYPDAFGEFAGGWSAVGYRYLACSESDQAFTQSIKEHGPGPAPPERYSQEHALYVFFASGLSTIESIAYALHAIGWMLDPPRFDMSNDDDKRNVQPRSTCNAFETTFPNERFPAVLRDVIESNDYDEWSRIRNVLSHRVAPPRHHYLSTGVPGGGGPTGRGARWTNTPQPFASNG